MQSKYTGPSRGLKTPFRDKLEMYGKVTELVGVNNIRILCEDGIERICRIPGKMFKHIWIRQNDIVIIKLWDFQRSKADVIWRYFGHQITQLEKRKELNKLYEYTHDVIKTTEYSGHTEYKGHTSKYKRR